MNLTSEATWRALSELIRIGPLSVKIRVPKQLIRRSANLLVAGSRRPIALDRGMAVIQIDALLDHEVIVVEFGSA
jgi:hypothetical protein